MKGHRLLIILVCLALTGCGLHPMPTAAPTRIPTAAAVATVTAAPTAAPSATATATATPAATAALERPATEPMTLIDVDRLLGDIEGLSSIRPHAGWRNSATPGEAEGLDYVARRLSALPYLQGLGLGLERQEFAVYLATELRTARLRLTVDGQEMDLPVDAQRGPRDDLAAALRFDSDGQANDTRPDPVTAAGAPLIVHSAQEVDRLTPTEVRGKVVFLDEAAVDRIVRSNAAVATAQELLQKGPAGVVLVTQYSNQPGQAHGTFAGDLSAFCYVQGVPHLPILDLRLEDAPSGWDGLARAQAAQLTWDADVYSPGRSGNLIARIPGADPSKAIILGAHIDSPANPGAMDDASGCAVLLEVARVLDAAHAQPPVDLYLAWFGSEELGLYGSDYFAATHQELLDRTLAMLQVDCLSRPLEGVPATLSLVGWSYGRLGDAGLPWPDYLARQVQPLGIEATPSNLYGLESDNSALSGFDVPNANAIYMDEPAMDPIGGVHYAGHLHDPYDTIELAREQAPVLQQMAQLALTAALATGREQPALRTAGTPDRRAVLVASHTEAVHMTPAALTDLGMLLAWEGYDVDMVPYGQPLTPADLQGASLVVALPVCDYAAPGDPGQGEGWQPQEVDALAAYVAAGGLLVVTGSAHRLKYMNQVWDENEDWAAMNALSSRLGVTFQSGALPGAEAAVEGQSPLTAGVSSLELAPNNAVPFAAPGAQVLARVSGLPVVALLQPAGARGQVLVLADLGILGAASEPQNLPFWRNLARYAGGEQ